MLSKWENKYACDLIHHLGDMWRAPRRFVNWGWVSRSLAKLRHCLIYPKSVKYKSETKAVVRRQLKVMFVKIEGRIGLISDCLLTDDRHAWKRKVFVNLFWFSYLLQTLVQRSLETWPLSRISGLVYIHYMVRELWFLWTWNAARELLESLEVRKNTS